MVEQNIICIKGDVVDLCVPRNDAEAIEFYTKWMNDSEINMWIGKHNHVTSRASEEKWAARDHTGTFNIVDKTGKMLGNCSAERVGTTRNYTLGICIGEQAGRDHGIGTEVIKMLIKYCFEECNAHRVRLTLNGHNARAKRCYEKAGMKVCGVEHETTWFNGHWSDTVYMEILESEYFSQ